MFATTSEAYLEFRDYIDALPDSAFVPKPGDRRPNRRARALAKLVPKSNSSADRARNENIFSHKKIAHIKQVRAAVKETRAATH